MYSPNKLRFGLVSLCVLIAFSWAIAATAEPSKDKIEKKPVAKAVVAPAVDSASRNSDSLRTPAAAGRRVIAYYFHGNVRCPSCRKIEAYTREAIDSAFGESLNSGQLEWRVVNTDSAQNEHYLQDYQLFTKSVVVSEVLDGKEARWKNLDKVWELLGDQEKFHSYIISELRTFMESPK